MLPLNLGVGAWPILLVGRGAALERRITLIQEAGAQDMRVHDMGDNDLTAPPPTRMPTQAEIAQARLLLVAGLPRQTAQGLADIARRHRVLVNVEDMPELCDFHVPALVRRGDLTIAISTSGQSPGLAATLRRRLAQQFDPAWAGHVAAAAQLRAQMRHAGKAAAEITLAMEHCADTWLGPPLPP